MIHFGSCHCGEVKFEVDMDLKSVVSCNCSMCQRKGSLLSFVPAGRFELLSGADSLKDYQFGKKQIHHYFCSNCGVSSFSSGQSPDGQEIRAINVRCLDGVDLASLEIQHVDGKSF